ncbi:MAG: hypothetical protein ACT4R6_12900 [Gemmatimonadaceae bacterium]
MPFLSSLLIRQRPALRFGYMGEIGQRQAVNADAVVKALERVIAAAERLAAQPVAAVNAENFASLLQQLRALRERAASGDTITTEELGAIVRFVSDWLPDEQFGLIGQLGAVVRAAQRTGRRRKRRSPPR